MAFLLGLSPLLLSALCKAHPMMPLLQAARRCRRRGLTVKVLDMGLSQMMFGAALSQMMSKSSDFG